MNPYRNLMLASLMQQSENEEPPKVAVGLDAFKNADVAENIGADKLAKKKYNPYGLILQKEVDQSFPDPSQVKKKSFNQELMRDGKE